MLNAFLLLMLGAQSAPPPLMVVREAPPAPIITPSARSQAYRDRETGPPAILDIRVSGEDGFAWRDTLRVAHRAPASVTQSRTEAPSGRCPAEIQYDYGVRANFTITVNVRSTSNFSVSIDWTRPASLDGCTAAGSRTVRLSQTVELAPGQSVMLEGDAGLKVEIKRR